MSFFDDNKIVTEDLITEHNFGMLTNFHRPFGLHSHLASDGGPILLTESFKDQSSLLPVDPHLKKHLVILSSSGERIAELERPLNLAAAFFLKNENLVVLKQDCTFHVHNIHRYKEDRNSIDKELPLRHYFMNEQNNEENIRLCVSDGGSMVILAGNGSLHFVFRLENPRRVQLLPTSTDYIFDKFYEDSIVYFSRPNGKEYVFYVACLSSGLLRIVFDGKETTATRILGHINGRIVRVSLSPSQKILAAITDSWNVFVFKTNDFNSQFRIDLQMTEKDVQRFRRLEWIKDHTICLCFTRYVRFVTRTQTLPFEKDFPSGLNSGEYQLLYGREVDGLRILAVDRHGIANNLLIRKISTAHENVKGMLSFSPGAVLYIIYKNFEKKRLPKEEDIIDDQKKLKEGVAEIVRAAKYELNMKKQKRLLNAAAYGKIFIDDENFDNNIIYQISRDIKIWANIVMKTNRHISFKQFKHVQQDGFDDFVEVLVSLNKFQLAFYFCSFLKRKKKAINGIFKKWVEALLTKNDNDAQCASTIIATFNGIIETNDALEPTVLLELASKAAKEGRQRLAEILLEKENPALLKISVYIDMGQYGNALNEALKENDSSCLYLIISKIVNLPNPKKRNDLLFDFVIKKKGCLVNHLFKFLETTKNFSFYNQVAGSLEEPKTFYLKSKAEYTRHSGVGVADLCGTRISLLKDSLSRVDKSDRTTSNIMANYINYYNQAGSMLKSGRSKQVTNSFVKEMNSDSFLTPLFENRRADYLYTPFFNFDKEILKMADSLRISTKQLSLKRIAYMLENLDDKTLKALMAYLVSAKKKGVSIFQIRYLFVKKGKRKEFLEFLDKVDFREVFPQFEARHLYYEAVYLTIVNKKPEEFGELINRIAVPKEKEELKELAKTKMLI